MRFGDTPAAPPVAAPLLGQHTCAVLEEVLAWDDERIAQARHGGAFGARTP